MAAGDAAAAVTAPVTTSPAGIQMIPPRPRGRVRADVGKGVEPAVAAT